MEDWNGGRVSSSWSYGHEIGSNVSSSRSGTIVSNLSTAYASSGSRFSVEAVAMHFDSLGIHGDVNGGNFRDWQGAEEERIRCLVQEFFSAPAPSANCSIKRGDMSVIERWLKELGVGWVLSLQHGASAVEFDCDAWTQTWIRALGHITQTLCFAWRLFPDCGYVDLPGICEEGEPVAENSVPDRYHLALFIQETMLKMLNSVPDRYHLALFIQETMLKMLAFVDVVVAWNPNMTEEFLSIGMVMLPPQLFNKLAVHEALSKASGQIPTMFGSPTSVEAERIVNEMSTHLSAYKSKLCGATRSTMEKIWTKLMEGDDGSASPQGSSDIHTVARSVMAYIRLLCCNFSSVDAAICDKYVPPIENESPFEGMIMEMVSCLQEKLASISESLPDQALKFLFLLNNTYFILECLDLLRLQQSLLQLRVHLNNQIWSHIVEGYLQVSWAPMLACLFFDSTLAKYYMPFFFGKKYSPMSKFESEFQKIYTTQKQWKVPNPMLRIRLHKVITDKIIPGYTEYIEDNKVTNPKFSPRELKEMLQELFEG